jgi:Flp pilus assembly pilin Flp
MITFAASALLKMAYSSLIAGVGAVVVFSLAIFGTVRAGDARRANRDAAAALYGTLAGLSVVISVAIVAYGLFLVAHKS